MKRDYVAEACKKGMDPLQHLVNCINYAEGRKVSRAKLRAMRQELERLRVEGRTRVVEGESQTQRINRAVLDQFDRGPSTNREIRKQRADTVSEFTRIVMPEDGIGDRLLPPIQISEDELDRQVDTDKPVIICNKEPGEDPDFVPSVPFGSITAEDVERRVQQYKKEGRFGLTFRRRRK
jgi:hypothetical protein